MPRVPCRHPAACRAALLGAGALLGLLAPGAIGQQGAGPDDQGAPEPPASAPIPAPALAASPTAAPGANVVIVLRRGERINGVLLERTASDIAVRVAGVDVRIPNEDIERIETVRPLVDRYREMRALIDDGDIERLLLLAEWCRANGLLDEATAELDHVLRVSPTSAEARRLQTLVARQRALRDGAASPEALDAGRPTVTDRAIAPRREPARIPLLTPEQINLVKVYEMDLAESPRVVIDRDTVERLMTAYGGDPLIPHTREGRDAFHNLPPAEILAIMFRLQAREFYGEVKVLGNPPALTSFRDNVNRGWLAVSCGSLACHGGEDAGDFKLVNRRSAAEPSFYTNHTIVLRGALADGTPLIDFESPERSALLHLGLPRNDSLHPHPEVRGWSPVFRNKEARRFQQAVAWIDALYRPRPEYPFEYPPPPTQGTADGVVDGAGKPEPDPAAAPPVVR